MPFKSFSDFDYVPGQNLLPDDYIVGYREFNKELRTKLSDLTIELLKNVDLQAAPEVLYVNTNGSDTNSGRSEYRAFRTLKRACAKALEISRANMTDAGKALENGLGVWGIGSQSVNIFIRTGEYIEDNPIYLPPRCTIIGDNLRSVTIAPKNRFYDIIWINHGCYVWGMTFRRHAKPAYAIAFPELKYSNGEVLQSYTTDTRVNAATATAKGYFKDETTQNAFGFPLRGPDNFDATRETFNNPQNLSLDFGDAIYDPARIAFLRRYFTGLNSVFFNEIENIGTNGRGDDLDTTDYYLQNVKRPYVLTSPYPQGNSSITQSTSAGADDAGGGVLVDGFKVEGPTRSMVMDSFTQFNEGGKGIHIINNGYAQLVSTFTICCTEGVMCETGGTCSINTSNCSFGLSGLVALGKSPGATLIGNLETAINGITNVVQVNNLSAFASEQEFDTDFQPYPGQIFEIIIAGVGPNQEGVTVNNGGSLFSILSASRIQSYIADGQPRYRCSLVLDANYSPALDATLQNAGLTEVPAGSQIKFYIRSTITASAHTLEYIGTGTTLLSAVPQNGGQTDVAKEVVFDDEGRVFFTSTNQFGDFRIGPGLTIVQATGTIEGETFQRSILTTITPFSIAIAGNI